MRTHNSYDYGRRDFQPPLGDDGPVLFTLGGLLVVGVIFYVLVSRFHLRTYQLVELSLYLLCFSGAVLAIVNYLTKRKKRIENAWPHPPVFVPALKDHKYLETAFDRQSVVPAYDIYGRPWYWSDEARRMQTVVAGQSGSGKTTLLLNIASQDIRRTVNGRYLPLIIFDGKGDQQFLNDVLLEISAAGRMHHLRILDPFRPEISVRFNPLYNKGGSSQELVNAFFDSFLQRQDFFRGHQAAYLSDICRVLDYTGCIYNIPDVLVMARDPQVMRDQIIKAGYQLDSQTDVSEARRRNFEMSARNLLRHADSASGYSPGR